MSFFLLRKGLCWGWSALSEVLRHLDRREMMAEGWARVSTSTNWKGDGFIGLKSGTIKEEDAHLMIYLIRLKVNASNIIGIIYGIYLPNY